MRSADQPSLEAARQKRAGLGGGVGGLLLYVAVAFESWSFVADSR